LNGFTNYTPLRYLTFKDGNGRRRRKCEKKEREMIEVHS
jgi:hypothetical protein